MLETLDRSGKSRAMPCTSGTNFFSRLVNPPKAELAPKKENNASQVEARSETESSVARATNQRLLTSLRSSSWIGADILRLQAQCPFSIHEDTHEPRRRYASSRAHHHRRHRNQDRVSPRRGAAAARGTWRIPVHPRPVSHHVQ